MQATDILSSEHRVIESVIASLEAGVLRLENDLPMRPGFFIEATDFIKGFADGCHHKKEEGVLFTTMQAHGMPTDSGPIAVMLSDHEQGRIFTRGLRTAAEALERGDQSARQDIIDNARGYAALLRAHIMKEDHILFPMADKIIPASQHEQVYLDFERVEHEETGEGVHEKYLALAERLAQEVQE